MHLIYYSVPVESRVVSVSVYESVWHGYLQNHVTGLEFFVHVPCGSGLVLL